MQLVIVESPTKAKTLSRFLGEGFDVVATMGHIKDLPKSKFGVDVENDFEPQYEWVEKRKDVIKELEAKGRKAKSIYLATDPDREGEAIAAHIRDLFLNAKPKVTNKNLKRIVFHEITKEALEEGLGNPRDINLHLVDAQIARRVLDRIVGYRLSPLLWKKVRIGLSAGRVQTVAVRLIVEREKEIKSFVPEEYWDIFVELKALSDSNNQNNFVVQLVKVNGKKAEIENKDIAEKIVSGLKKADYRVFNVEKKEVVKNPYPPFTTSTMAQASSRVFGWSSKRTMRVAQLLYEKGFITYHRTDSFNLSKSAVEKARGYIKKNFGDKYLPSLSNFFKTRSKSAQEAHEAIRPTNVNSKFEARNGSTGSPSRAGSRDSKWGNDAKKLYELVWKRFLACQMTPSVYDQTGIKVEAKFVKEEYLLETLGSVIKFDGWQILYGKGGEKENVKLPDLKTGEALRLNKVLPEQKFTQPPARYTEATLIKTLEKLGIGRPSTYAPVISTIQVRQYVEKNEGKFFATPVGIAVNDFLVPNFEKTFDYSFTANMEDELDQIADGKVEWRGLIKEFYIPFNKILTKVEKESKRVKIETEKLGKPCPLCGKKGTPLEASAKWGELVVRTGRYGKFISCSRFPDCKYTQKYLQKLGIKCQECKSLRPAGPEARWGEVIVKKSKRGRKFFGCSRYPDCKWASWTKPVSQGEAFRG